MKSPPQTRLKTVLFVCAGNTCRSPMAEAIARQAVERGVLGDCANIFVASAGVSAGEGAPTSGETVDALRRMKIDFSGHSTPLTAEMVRKADLVLCMTHSQAEYVRDLLGPDAGSEVRIAALDPDGDIEDPIGLGQDTYDRLARRLADLIPRRLKEMLPR